MPTPPMTPQKPRTWLPAELGLPVLNEFTKAKKLGRAPAMVEKRIRVLIRRHAARPLLDGAPGGVETPTGSSVETSSHDQRGFRAYRKGDFPSRRWATLRAAANAFAASWLAETKRHGYIPFGPDRRPRSNAHRDRPLIQQRLRVAAATFAAGHKIDPDAAKIGRCGLGNAGAA